ncbi:uncharacterized protein [Amphiura filiformis]|uniref:uncharacterized protein n=1 Tax=Amphiura filiformis TaxID=82378 RepID=UPI003B2188BB
MCEDLQKNRENFNDREMVRSQYKPPPNDFRRIPIIPDINEIGKIKRPFLRHNLIKGKYQNTEHYLDVQFRLLREDFIAPLREGVGEYLDKKEDFEHNPRRRLQDVRLYHGVRIIRPVMTREGTGHLIQFDASHFKKTRWESSKRLITGSLLCLTKDDFETVIFATVEDRDVRYLQRGQIQMSFIRLADAIGKSSEATFLMAETSAYFESYRHVLRGLKEFTESSLPMKPYIVDASGKSNPPIYLHDFADSVPLYDLRITSQILKEDDKDRVSNEVDGECASAVHDDSGLTDECKDRICVLKASNKDSDATDIHLHNYVQGKLRAVNVLEPSTWPEADTLHFDESQLEAFRAALASEFVLIQGPPGTGKTYVGLQIVKTLLFNCHAWCHGESEEDWDNRPILVVCYTNHALDQFLEGIYEYEKNIVRVGGRCKADSLQHCCIANIKHAKRKSRQVPDHIHRRRADIQEYYDMRDILEAAHERIALAQTKVLRPSTIFHEKLMSREQYRRLLSGSNNVNTMYVWLGLDGRGLPKLPSKPRSATGEESIDSEDVGNDEVGKEEEKVDFAEEAALLVEQRELGNDPIFLQYKEKSRARLVGDFAVVPEKRFNGDTRKEIQDRLKVAIENEINSTDVMSVNDVSGIQNVWELSYHERWRLYRYWVARFIKTQEDIMLRYQVAFQQLSEMRKEIDREEDYLILKQANVIGFTTTGAAKNREILQRIRPRIIVVEEAAEVLEAHIITTLSQDCQHLILIGDHQQLRPNPTVYRLAKNYHLDVSLFERMINNGLPCHRLGQQHRMRPEISILMKEHFYDGLQDHTSVMSFSSVKGVAKNMFFLEHDQTEIKMDDNQSKSNLHEAKFLVELCYYFLQQGYDPSQITILTTYTGQLFNFKQLMSKQKFEGVRVSVVDNFQGEENEIILLSLVRSNEDGSIGFLKVHNRVCVALSRARKGLFCIGNIRLLAEQSSLWKNIMKTTTATAQIGPKLPLVCQNHVETVTEVSCPEDFSNLVPNGGCSLRCDARLDCGHACRLYCHPKDRKHEEYKCLKDCSTICPRGHKCSLKCYEECKCQVLLTKHFAKCQHTEKVKCYENETALCQRLCSSKLPCKHDCPAKCGEECPECPKRCPKKIRCGHDCKRKCGRPCSTTSECEVKVKVKPSNCDHSYWVKCKNDPQWRSLQQHPPCNAPCVRILKCGHKCNKLCRDRCQTECEEEIIKTWSTCKPYRQMLKRMPCGHYTEVPCNVDVNKFECIEDCLKILPCGHRCQKKCGYPCTVVCKENQEKKILDCGHKVTIHCDQDPDRSMCREKCVNKLICGHLCQRLCREKCEEICTAIVNKEFPNCKHKCKLPCQQDPKTIKCGKSCDTILPCKHKCADKCGDPCTSQCRVKVRKQHPKCGHYLNVLCYEDVTTKSCREPCQKTLPCKHNCSKMCFEPCKTIEDTSSEPSNTNKDADGSLFLDLYKCARQEFMTPTKWPVCKERVQKSATCGHQIECLCCENPDSIQCQSPCTKALPCKHQCPGVCSMRCETVQCKIIIAKRIPICGHVVKLKCSEDPTTAICQEPCAKKLPCGHPCSKLCSEPCVTPRDVCREFVTRKLPGCGHETKLQCHQDPAKTKKLKCGHTCRSTCHHTLQACETNCRVKVHKNITRCGHTVKLPCHLDPDSGLYCEHKCEQLLECGHECKEKCGRTCTKLCKETANVRKVLPCKHVARDVACFENPSDVFCREQCTNRLGCGHECKNVCGECTHRVRRRGGKLSRCVEACRKRLLCGHQCKSRCRDCFGGRIHQHCSVLINEVTLLCGCKVKERCSKLLSIKHVPDMQLCLLQHSRIHRRQEGELQDSCEHNPSTGYCNEPCTKLLPCKHTCIGICGEPCIDLCRFCNRRKILKIFPEFRAKTDPCYIKLEECGHIFEENELKRKLGMISPTSACVPILPVTCPKCGASICERRFNGHASKVTESVRYIDRLLHEDTSSELKEAEDLLSRSKYRHSTQNARQTIPGRSKTQIVPRTITREAQAEMAWKLRLLDNLDKIQPITSCSRLQDDHDDHLISRFRDIQMVILQEVSVRLEKLLDEKTFLTEQLAEDLGCELERVQWCAALEKLIRTLAYRKRIGKEELGTVRTSAAKAVEIITSPRPFTVQRQKEMIVTLGTRLAASLKGDNTELSREGLIDMQRKQKGFLAGDWFKCSRDPDHMFHSHAHVKRRNSAKSTDLTASCPWCEKAYM